MNLLITGGTGFVMSVVAREWLERHPDRRAVILDRAGLDTTAQAWFAPVRERLTVVEGDVRDPSGWSAELDRHEITAVVHGATVTPISRGSAQEAARLPPEALMPARIMDINLMGTVQLLEWARQSATIKRFIYISSGSVYRHHGPDWSPEPLPEDGYVAPLTLYGISKFASEMVANRYADLFGLSVASVRLSSIYGPMDRATESRNFRHVPNRRSHPAQQLATRGRLSAFGGRCAGDSCAHGSIATALPALQRGERCDHEYWRHHRLGGGARARYSLRSC
jgi:UDP-glucose 4-epimerase